MKLKTIFIILLIVLIIFCAFISKSNKKQKDISSVAPPIVQEVQAEVESFMDSPDGSMSLILEDSLTVVSEAIGQKTLLNKKEIDSRKFEIPYNTWSPDNAYVFLKEKTLNIDDYLVFQSSGNMFSNNLPYVSIKDLFNKNIPNYIIEDVTGWAAPNLLIINTKAKDSDQKVSFWFDVPSQSFIQLGTYFK